MNAHRPKGPNISDLHNQALAAILRLAFDHARGGAALARGGHMPHLAGGGGGGGGGPSGVSPQADASSTPGTPGSPDASSSTGPAPVDATAPMPGEEDPEATPEVGLAPEVGPAPTVTDLDKNVPPPPTPETTVEKGFQATPMVNPAAAELEEANAPTPVSTDPEGAAQSAAAAAAAQSAAVAAAGENAPMSADAEVAEGQAAEGQAAAEADAAAAAAADTSGATDAPADWKGGSVRGHHEEITHLMRRLIDAYERQGRAGARR